MFSIRNTTSIFIFLIVAQLSLPVYSENTIAVLPFKGIDTLQSTREKGARIAEYISAFMGKSGLVQLVERIQLEKVTSEIALGMSGLVDETKAVEAGKLAGADMIIVGSFEYDGKKIKINARIVEVVSGKIKGTTLEEGTSENDVLTRVSISLLSENGIKTIPNTVYKMKKVAAISSGAAGVITAGLCIWSHFTYEKADETYRTRYDLSRNEYKEIRDKAEFHLNARYYFGGVSAATIAAGIYLLISNRTQWKFSKAEAQRTSAVFNISADSFRFGLQYHF